MPTLLTHARPTIVATGSVHLRALIKEEIAKNGQWCDLNHIDVSRVKAMTGLFEKSSFYGDISKWDVSNVKTFARMFRLAGFNGDLSQWNTSGAPCLDGTFEKSR